jgi:hypothetical protein
MIIAVLTAHGLADGAGGLADFGKRGGAFAPKGD